ncbi:hypothetical protein HH214_07460 [Mucilaginibacter robiniae]|uniref:Uncharacterized protein n=1 Tax=Mucilaginibacter robiniae TaxID=2728022 RepID=A0A7L5DX95_9SPHI|nr:hypothetical protein [Mucilaginibacter robiniae]QJD95720.1 hypothetical protein HH214_07460 [Mucilaginibacter robiniae]
MNTQEIQEQLRDNQEVLMSHAERIGSLEKKGTGMRPVPPPDYSRDFAEIKQSLEELVKAATPAKQAEELTSIVNSLLAKMPEKIKTVIEYRLTGASKPVLLSGACALLVLIGSVSLNISLWRENGRLETGDTKLNLLRQKYPAISEWADSAYVHLDDSLWKKRDVDDDNQRSQVQQKERRGQPGRRRKSLLGR